MSFILPLPPVPAQACSHQHNNAEASCCLPSKEAEDYLQQLIENNQLEAPKQLIYGSCISIQDSLYETAQLQRKYALSAVQIYLGNGRGYTVRQISETDSQQATALLEAHNSKMHIHASLLINLCSSTEGVQERSSVCLQTTLNQIVKFPGHCICHIGSSRNPNKFASIRTVADHVNSLNNKESLLMETSAGEKNDVGNTWEDLRMLYESLDRSVNLCLDTQHLFAAGMSPLQTPEHVNNLFDQVEFITGRSDRCKVMHLNDSVVAYEGHVDRHEELFKGHRVAIIHNLVWQLYYSEVENTL